MNANTEVFSSDRAPEQTFPSARAKRETRAMTDKQLLRCATQFRKGMIGNSSSYMKCAMVSWPLAALLSASGVKCKTVEGDLGECNHVWIELEDGRVLDATADQFNYFPGQNMPPVYLGPPTAMHPTSEKTAPC